LAYTLHNNPGVATYRVPHSRRKLDQGNTAVVSAEPFKSSVPDLMFTSDSKGERPSASYIAMEVQPGSLNPSFQQKI
jgi:hypothetical protein